MMHARVDGETVAMPTHCHRRRPHGGQHAFSAPRDESHLQSRSVARHRKGLAHEHALAAGAIAAPAEALVSVDATWDNATATHGKLDTFQPGTVRGGHAPCVVGYTADNRFIIRNSWGTTWGDQGLAYASEAYVNAAFFDESYGVTL
jgi:C1A family cysteine protease